MALKTREGNKNHLGGQVSASPFMVKGLFEGPLATLNGDDGHVSFALTTKRSIIDETSSAVIFSCPHLLIFYPDNIFNKDSFF